MTPDQVMFSKWRALQRAVMEKYPGYPSRGWKVTSSEVLDSLGSGTSYVLLAQLESASPGDPCKGVTLEILPKMSDPTAPRNVLENFPAILSANVLLPFLNEVASTYATGRQKATVYELACEEAIKSLDGALQFVHYVR